MMRYAALALSLLVAACSSQGRNDDDPWEGYEPDPDLKTYDESYTPPAGTGVDKLVARAQEAERSGRDDIARVEYHAAFKRDRWHPGANEGYQDLMLRNELFETVWQEYLDLWQQNPERGDAFRFHLRPLMQQRADAEVPQERQRSIGEADQTRITELQAQAAENLEAGDRQAAVTALDAAIEIADTVELHRQRIALLHAGDYSALLQEYEEYADEDPASGDRLYLHAHVLSLRDPAKALNLLREGWIIELPGWWLRFGIGEISMGLGDTEDSEVRSATGWYAAAFWFLDRCVKAQPANAEAGAMLERAVKSLVK